MEIELERQIVALKEKFSVASSDEASHGSLIVFRGGGKFVINKPYNNNTIKINCRAAGDGRLKYLSTENTVSVLVNEAISLGGLTLQ